MQLNGLIANIDHVTWNRLFLVSKWVATMRCAPIISATTRLQSC